MTEETSETLSQDLATQVTVEQQRMDDNLNALPPVSAPELPVEMSAAPLSASDVILGVKADREFLGWALDSTIAFLDLADSSPIATVSALRGVKENAIRDKVQMANSMLVLLANYGSQRDNKELVTACETYADKMKTIIKRLCL